MHSPRPWQHVPVDPLYQILLSQHPRFHQHKRWLSMRAEVINSTVGPSKRRSVPPQDSEDGQITSIDFLSKFCGTLEIQYHFCNGDIGLVAFSNHYTASDTSYLDFTLHQTFIDLETARAAKHRLVIARRHVHVAGSCIPDPSQYIITTKRLGSCVDVSCIYFRCCDGIFRNALHEAITINGTPSSQTLESVVTTDWCDLGTSPYSRLLPAQIKAGFSSYSFNDYEPEFHYWLNDKNAEHVFEDVRVELAISNNLRQCARSYRKNGKMKGTFYTFKGSE